MHLHFAYNVRKKTTCNMLEITAAHPRSALTHAIGNHIEGVMCFIECQLVCVLIDSARQLSVKAAFYSVLPHHCYL